MFAIYLGVILLALMCLLTKINWVSYELFHKSYLFVGPVMTKFTIALREIGTYKEVLRSQVITMICFPIYVSKMLLHVG